MVNHRNNIGLLRLLFASLVIIGHAPELIDGDRRREPLTMLFHSVSLGELSVDAFFLISGFLITQSLINTHSYRTYFERRIMRIWPGYIVACLLCSFVLAPLVGGHPFSAGPGPLAKMVLLKGPLDTAGQLAGLKCPLLNGAMWTIWLEFGCYVMIAGLALVRVLQRPVAVALLAAVALSLTTLNSFAGFREAVGDLRFHGLEYYVFGDPMRLAAFFLVGALGYLRRDWLLQRVNGTVAAGAAVAAAIGLTSPHTAQIGLALGGGLVVLWLSFKADLGHAQQINDRWDISYGTYLYGWPIATALLYFAKLTSPMALIAYTLPLALLAGAASWWLVEKGAKDFFRSRTERNPATLAVRRDAT